MHWWPWLLIAFTILFGSLSFIPSIGIVLFVLGVISIFLFGIFIIIWNWKMFRYLRKPEWWALSLIIPIIGNLLYLVFVGIAAWSKKGDKIKHIKKDVKGGEKK